MRGAGRDPSTLDITFSNTSAETRRTTTSTPTPILEGVEKLAALGVTWMQAHVPGDSVAHAVEAIEKFGKTVIAAQ